jgi:hypothetical protein
MHGVRASGTAVLGQVLATVTAYPTSRRILVIDDNDALRANIREMLGQRGRIMPGSTPRRGH